MKLLPILVFVLAIALNIVSVNWNDAEDNLKETRKLLRDFQSKVNDLDYKNKKARNLLSEVFDRDMISFTVASTRVTVTAYSATEAETDSTPETTADMTSSRIGLLAVSRDMLDYLDYGQVVVLPSLGVFRVSDTMAKRFTRRVDILHSSAKAARIFGRREGQKLMWVF